MAGPRRLPGSHVVAGWHGRRRLAARGIRCPAGTAWAHPGLVTRTRRRGSGPAGRRPVLAPPADRRSRGVLGSAAVRRSAGFPGWAGLLASRTRGHPWARRAGRPVSTRSSVSARTAGQNALRRRARRDRCLRPGRQRGAGPGGVPAMCRALVTCRARGTPQVADGRSPSGDPPYPQAAGTFRLYRSARWRRSPGPPGRTRRQPRPRPAPAGSYWRAHAWSKAA